MNEPKATSTKKNFNKYNQFRLEKCLIQTKEYIIVNTYIYFERLHFCTGTKIRLPFSRLTDNSAHEHYFTINDCQSYNVKLNSKLKPSKI